jgi:3-oxoacyl-[acyl-carrier-protein] synthase III
VARTAVLAGVGGYVPPTIVTNTELARQLGLADDWIESRTGIRCRHVVDAGTSTGDLAVEAGARALKSAGHAAVDAVVLATATPDHPMPATAPAVAARLGLCGVPAYDLNAVCAGFIYALASGAMLIRGDLAERVLVIGADAFSSIVPMSDPVIGPLFGDGAGAVVLRAGEEDEPGALIDFDLGSDGELAELIMIPGGGARQRSGGAPADSDGMYFTMDGKRVFTAAVTRMAQSSKALLGKLGRAAADVDRIVGHQANARILRAIAMQLDVPPERLVMNIDRVGNTSAASIPLALADAVREGGLEAGQFVLLTGFGGGLAWGSTALIWPAVSAH